MPKAIDFDMPLTLEVIRLGPKRPKKPVISDLCPVCESSNTDRVSPATVLGAPGWVRQDDGGYLGCASCGHTWHAPLVSDGSTSLVGPDRYGDRVQVLVASPGVPPFTSDGEWSGIAMIEGYPVHSLGGVIRAEYRALAIALRKLAARLDPDQEGAE